MATDPFKPKADPADEAQQDTVTPRGDREQAKPGPVVSTEDPIKVTIKGGPGQHEPWVTWSFSSIEDAAETLTDVENREAMAEVFQAVREASDFFIGTGGSGQTSDRKEGRSDGRRGDSGGDRRSSAPRDAVDAPEWMGRAPSCDHGKMVYKTGEGRKGTWYAWMCPDRVDGCDPEWKNAPSSGRRGR